MNRDTQNQNGVKGQDKSYVSPILFQLNISRDQAYNRPRSYSCTSRRRLQDFNGANKPGKEYLTEKSSQSGYSSEGLSLQIANVNYEIENITSQMTKNIVDQKQIQKRIKQKIQVRQKEILENQKNISQLKEKIGLKDHLIELFRLMDNQHKRINYDQPMSIEQNIQIYKYIRNKKSQKEQNSKQAIDQYKHQITLKQEMQRKDIDNQMKKKFQDLQDTLLNKKIDDQNLSLQKKFQKRLIQFKLQKGNELQQIMNKEIQLIKYNFDTESDIYLLNVKQQQQLQQYAQNNEENLSLIKQKYKKTMQSIQNTFDQQIDELYNKFPNIQKMTERQQLQIKYQNDIQICQKTFQEEKSFCLSQYQSKKKDLYNKFKRDVQPKLKLYPKKKKIYLEKLNNYQEQLQKCMQVYMQWKTKYEREYKKIDKMRIQAYQQMQEEYRRDQDHLQQCFKSKQPQKSRFFIQKHYENKKRQYQNLKALLQKQLQKQQRYKQKIIQKQQEQLRFLKHQYDELKFQKRILYENQRQLLILQQSKFNFRKIQQKSNQQIVFRRLNVIKKENK